MLKPCEGCGTLFGPKPNSNGYGFRLIRWRRQRFCSVACGGVGRPRDDSPPSYKAVHKRLRADRGPAVEYDCDHCGGPAAQWAFDHERHEPTGYDERCGVYSADLLAYVPLCQACHYAYDGAHLKAYRAGVLVG